VPLVVKALTAPLRTPPRAGRDATIYEVARRAGVSIATVSRVLRGTAAPGHLGHRAAPGLTAPG